MEVKAWIDFLCIFSYASTMAFKKAMEENPREIVYKHKAMELMPSLENTEGLTDLELTARMMETDETSAFEAVIEEIGDSLSRSGADFKPQKAIAFNTKNYHKLAYIAEEKGQVLPFVYKVFENYFVKGVDLRADEGLKSLIKDFDLGEDAFERLKNDKDLENRFRKDIREFKESPGETLPYYEINEKPSPNSKTTEEFIEIFDRI